RRPGGSVGRARHVEVGIAAAVGEPGHVDPPVLPEHDARVLVLGRTPHRQERGLSGRERPAGLGDRLVLAGRPEEQDRKDATHAGRPPVTGWGFRGGRDADARLLREDAMKAVVYDEYAPDDDFARILKIQDVPEPTPRWNEVVFRVEAAALNFDD